MKRQRKIHPNKTNQALSNLKRSPAQFLENRHNETG
jgi:hypothetical protein